MKTYNSKRLYELGQKVILNGKEEIIDDAIYNGWTGWFYKLIGHTKWYSQELFNH